MASLLPAVRSIARHPPMRRVLTAYALGAVVQFATWVAIILYAFDRGGVDLAAVVAVVQILPAALLAPALMGQLERIPRGAALAAAYAVVAISALATSAALLLSAPVPVAVGGSALTSVGLALVRPLHFAALPRLSREPHELVSANAVSSMGDGVALFAGPVLAGVGVEVGGPALVFAGSATAALVAGLLCRGLDLGRARSGADSEGAGWRLAIQGLLALWRDWAALALLVILATRFLIGGAVDVLGISFAESVLNQDASGAGLVIGIIGIGALVGGALAGAVSLRRHLAPVVLAGAVIQGLAFAAVALTGALVPALVVLALCGAGGAILLVAGRTLLQRSTDDRVLAQVFAVQEGVALLGVALGAALAPVLVRQWGPAEAFIPLGLGAVVIAVACALLLGRLDVKAVLLPDRIRLLQRVPLFDGLPPYDLERLARATTWLPVRSGDDIVRQGEPGELFYIVGEGEFSVTVDGSTAPTRLVSGDGFGELALLRSEPRSATVRAEADGRLLSLGRDDFLAVVTGRVDGRALADDLSRRYEERGGAPEA